MVDRGDQTRARMLEAGVQQVHDATLTQLLSFLRPADIAAAAGRSKSTFFHHWPTFEAYVHELMATVWVDPAEEPVLSNALADLRRERIEPNAPSIIDWVRGISLMAFDKVNADPRLPLQFLGPVSGDAAHRAALVDRYRQLDDNTGQIIEHYLDGLSYGLREPFSGSSLALTINSLLLGLTMRARVDPERVTAMLYADVVAALLPVLVTDLESDALPFDEFLDSVMMRSAAEAPQAMPGFDPRPRSELRDLARQATDQLRTLFMPRLQHELEADLSSSSDRSVAVAHLQRLHDLARQHQATALAALGASVAGRFGSGAPFIPDVMGESGLNALTQRALQTGLPHDGHIAERATSANQWMFRTATGLEPLSPEQVIDLLVPVVGPSSRGRSGPR